MINFNKSMFMVSENTTSNAIQNIKDGIGIQLTTSLGQYLGLPFHISKNKNEVFGAIKE